MGFGSKKLPFSIHGFRQHHPYFQQLAFTTNAENVAPLPGRSETVYHSEPNHLFEPKKGASGWMRRCDAD